jgi:hypothetical protein
MQYWIATDFLCIDGHYGELLYTCSCSIVFSFAGPGEYESPAFMGKAKMGMICSKDGRFKPVKSLVPGPGAYAVSERDVCVCAHFISMTVCM